MGLISRVSSRTYRELANMLSRPVARFTTSRLLQASVRSQQTLNEHGGWVCKDRADFEKWWPELAEKQRLHSAQYQAHIPVHEQGKYGKYHTKFDYIFYHAIFIYSLIYGFKVLCLEIP